MAWPLYIYILCDAYLIFTVYLVFCSDHPLGNSSSAVVTFAPSSSSVEVSNNLIFAKSVCSPIFCGDRPPELPAK